MLTKWEEWLSTKKSLSKIIEEHYGKYIDISENGLDVLPLVNDDLGMLLQMAKGQGIIKDYFLSFNPNMVKIEPDLLFIELYYSYVFHDKSKYFSSIYFVSDKRYSKESIVYALQKRG